MLKKILASFLSVIVLISMCIACSSPALKSNVISVVNEFSVNLCKRNSSKLLKTVEVRNELQPLLDTYFDGKGFGKANKQVYDAILDTLSYELDESSYVINEYKDDAFVDVTFSMVDYSAIITEDDYKSVDELVQKLNAENNRINTKISVRTYFDGNKWMVDNTKVVLTSLFDEAYNTVSTYVNLSVVRSISNTWLGDIDLSTGKILNTNTIACMAEIEDYDTAENLRYYYEFYYNGELIATSSLMVADNGILSASEYSYLYDRLSTESGVPFIDEYLRLFLSGTYTVKFYDEYGVLFYEDSIECELDSGEYLWIDGTSYSYRWVATIDEQNTYLNPVAISLEIKFGDVTDDLIIDSYYTVTYDDELIYTSEPDSLIPDRGRIYYSFGKFFEECPLVEGDTNLMRSGSYKITVFDSATDEMILEESCFVFVW